MDFFTTTYFGTLLSCSAVFFFFHLIPALALNRAYPHIRKSTCLLAVCGWYAVSFYLKPKEMNLFFIPFFTVLVSTLMTYLLTYRTRKKIIFVFSWKDLGGTFFLVLYFFSIFLTRWEPPSLDDPVKWGTLARLIQEYQTVPGDTRPVTQIAHLTAATIGVPVQEAILSLGGRIPSERLTFFWSCLALVLFFRLFSIALHSWFPRNVSEITACIAAVIFTNPQSYLAWGGTPTLLGMASGFVVIAFLDQLKQEGTKLTQVWPYVFAIAWGAYAHPIGIFVAVLGFLPLFLSFLGQIPRKNFVLLGAVVIGSFLVTLPFFATARAPVSPFNLQWTRDWQKLMAPYLFREERNIFYNLYIQMTAYVWNTSALVSAALCVFMARKEKKLFTLFGLCTVVMGLMILNAKHWILPLSPLIYPERVGTLWIFPLAFGVAWALASWQGLQRNLLLGIFLILGGLQFRARLFPLWGGSVLTPNDRLVMKEISSEVPWADCIRVDRKWSGAWIPAISFRCTVPFHALGVNAIEEETGSQPKQLRWVFVGEKEREAKKELPEGERVLDHGALLIRIDRR